MPTAIHRLNRSLLARERDLRGGNGDRVAPWLKRLVGVTQVLTQVLVEFLDDHCFRMASALSYTSLLALVPVTTLFFSIFTAFQAFENLRAQLETFITGQLFFQNADIQQKVLHYVDQFADNSKHVGIVSVVALIVTVLSLLITVENSMNTIWKVTPRRTLTNRVITYSAFVFLAPLLLAFSLYLTNETTRTWALEELSARVPLWKLISGLGVSWFMFFLAYVAIPEARVRFRPAMAGALVAAASFEWAKWSFDRYIQGSVYFSVYQTLAIVPIFLLWLYLVWLIALVGMEVTYVVQNRDTLRLFTGPRLGESDLGEAALAATMARLALNFHDGRPEQNSRENLASALGIPPYQLVEILDHLEARGFVHRVLGGAGDYAPSRALSQTTIHDVIGGLHPENVLIRLAQRDPRVGALRDAFLRSLEYRRESLERIRFEDLAQVKGRT